MCITEYHSIVKKKNRIQPQNDNEILPFMTTWLDFEGIMLSEISQRQLLHSISCMWNYVSVHVYIHIYMHTHIYIYIYTHTYTRVCVCVKPIY